MKTIIAGMRTFTDYGKLSRAMRKIDFQVTEVVSGCASGVDALGERWAAENGIPVKKFPADWNTHGRAAGPIRNQQMAAYADALVAIWDGESRGTKNMIETARKKGMRIHIFYTTAQ